MCNYLDRINEAQKSGMLSKLTIINMRSAYKSGKLNHLDFALRYFKF